MHDDAHFAPPSATALPSDTGQLRRLAARSLLGSAAMSSASPSATHHVFDRLIDHCRALGPVAVAVVAPLSDFALLGVASAYDEKLIEPILVGPEGSMTRLAQKLGVELSNWPLVDAIDDSDAAAKAVALCRTGRARVLMKGSLHTDTLLHAVLQHDVGLRTARRLSHVFVLDAPLYPRPLLITDAGINIYPTLEEKVDIVRNAIDLAHALGIDVPNVAILSAVETVNPKITSTIDAAALCKMADRKQIAGAVLDGPLAFDTAVSADAAAIKNLTSRVAGVADVLVVPDIESGNMLAKQLEYLGAAELAGVVLGGRVPIVLTSRADPVRARLASCAVAATYARAQSAEGRLPHERE
jgi:phosphate acetyltransferase